MEIDPEWQVHVIRTNIDLKGQWEARCSTKGECWYWTPSKLMAYEEKHLREIPIRLHQNEYILDAFPVSNGVGWVVSTSGLFQTADSGTNWIQIDVPDFDRQSGQIHAVHFEDNKHGWIAGALYRSLVEGEPAPNNAISDDRSKVLVGAIARTIDGGLSWETIRLDRSIGRFNEVVFSDRVGLISGDAGLASTADGGETWKDVLASLKRKDIGYRPEVNATFIHKERCWVSISGARILTTEDGARTWRIIPLAAEMKDDAPPFSEFVFIDDRRGLALQTQFGAGRIYKTNNGGRSWTLLELSSGLSGLELIPGNNEIIAVGEGGVYLFTPG